MAKIASESGTSFDPRVIELLRRRYVELERKARSESQAAPTTKLSVDVKVRNSAAPDAGFETAAPVRLPAIVEGDAAAGEALLGARREVQAIFEASLPEGGTLEIAESLSLLSVRLRRFVNYDAFAVYFIREGVLVPEFVIGDDYRLFRSLRIPMGQGLSGWVAENRQPILNGNPSVEPGYLNDSKVFSTLRSALAVPLEGASGVIGVVSLYREGRDAFSTEEQVLLEALAPRVAIAIEEAASSDPSRLPADTIGSFPDAAALLRNLDSEMTRSRRLRMPLAIIVCHIHGLRRVREAAGAADANKALRSVTGALRDGCRDFEFIARTGLTDFVIVAPGLTSHAADARCGRIGQIVSGHGAHTVTVTTGASQFPDDGEDATQLLRAADRRLLASLRARRQSAPAATAS
jgi:diguanylate cyclase (GGDEF)-like protein